MLKNKDEGVKAEKLGGSGKGCAMRFPVEIPDNDGAFTMTTRIELEPGASIGYHLHGDNEEVYFIMSGSLPDWRHSSRYSVQRSFLLTPLRSNSFWM